VTINQNQRDWAIKTLVSENVYTGRQEFLDYFYQATLQARTRRTGSTVLLGQRRMGDLIDYKEFGGWFAKVDDPILLDFLKVWGRIEIEGYENSQVQEELQNQHSRLKRQFSELIGYLAEVYMAQILLNAQ
jgi:hypothetical protein